jgi:hypothetical protein
VKTLTSPVLPCLIPLALGNEGKFFFWNEAFAYTVHNAQTILKLILSCEGINLSSSQKEHFFFGINGYLILLSGGF